MLPLDVSVQQHPLLLLELSVLKQTLLPGCVYSIAACAASGLSKGSETVRQTVLPFYMYVNRQPLDLFILNQPVMPLFVSVLEQPKLPLHVNVLLFYSRLVLL